jgi:hypothetical protein
MLGPVVYQETMNFIDIDPSSFHECRNERARLAVPFDP